MWKFLFMERVSHGVQRTAAVQNTAECQNSINIIYHRHSRRHTTTMFFNEMRMRPIELANTIIVKGAVW